MLFEGAQCLAPSETSLVYWEAAKEWIARRRLVNFSHIRSKLLTKVQTPRSETHRAEEGAGDMEDAEGLGVAETEGPRTKLGMKPIAC